ncbi:MAG: asparagine synthase (glutamine-hydrolyzing) [Acidobacteriota bacterium]
MCGIAAIVASGARRFRAGIEAMTGALAHRGPDGQGYDFFERCVLGHSRLSIIDLSGGAQPMRGPGGLTSVSFNGEIYGYQDAKRALPDYPFATSSDTEVILALYRRHGAAAPEHLPGMFAFALWDEERQSLLCARDRFGEKPLYYAFGPGGELLVASEIKALAASGLIDPVLDLDALGHYLTYLYIHPSRTAYANVFTLPPAHSLEWRDGQVTVRPYWRLPEVDDSIGEKEAVERFRELMERSVARQMVADVPVGVLLSGGLDSSTIAALAARRSGRVLTFAFGFGNNIDELPYAQAVADMHGTDHHVLTDQDTSIAALILRMAQVHDEPFADSSCIPTYLISGLCREHVKVVLSGDGGDELLAGYDFWYRQLLDLGPQALSRHTLQKRYFTPEELSAMGFSGRLGAPSPSFTPDGRVDDAWRDDLTDYMPGDILVKTDRASMAHGLELRAPFLDADLAGFCASLPARLKIVPGQSKRILRLACSHLWPESVRVRGKQGFGAPVAAWLARPDVEELRRDMLLDPARGIWNLFDRKACLDLAGSHTYKAWILLTLSVWLEHNRLVP